MPGADVNKTERAVLITTRLLRGDAVSVRQLAHVCQVTPRTIYRDLVGVERLLPLKRDENGKISIQNFDE